MTRNVIGELFFYNLCLSSCGPIVNEPYPGISLFQFVYLSAWLHAVDNCDNHSSFSEDKLGGGDHLVAEIYTASPIYKGADCTYGLHNQLTIGDGHVEFLKVCRQKPLLWLEGSKERKKYQLRFVEYCMFSLPYINIFYSI